MTKEQQLDIFNRTKAMAIHKADGTTTINSDLFNMMCALAQQALQCSEPVDNVNSSEALEELELIGGAYLLRDDETVAEGFKEEYKIIKQALQRLINIDKNIELCKKINKQKYVYYKNGPKILKICYWLDFCYDVLNNKLFLAYGHGSGRWEVLDLNIYGKEWALTEEELNYYD